MNLNELFSPTETIQIAGIPKNDKQLIGEFTDLINSQLHDGKQLSTARVSIGLGTKGRLWGMYAGERLVGSIGIKPVMVGDAEAGEITYLYIEPEYRSAKTVLMLYKQALKYSRKFDMVYFTSYYANKGMNRLLDSNSKIKPVLKMKAPNSGQIMNVWISLIHNNRYTEEEQIQMLSDKFDKYIM